MQKRAAKGTGCLYKPKGKQFWYFKIRKNTGGISKSITFSTGTDNRKDAETFRAKCLTEMEKGIPIENRKIKFWELVQDYIHDYQVHEYRSLPDQITRFDTHILPFFGSLDPNKVNSADISSYIVHRKQQKASNGTINRELEAINRCFTLGKMHEKVHRAPFVSKLLEPKSRRGLNWPDPLFAAVLKHFNEDLADLLTFMNITGWRLSECQPFKWSNVDWNRRELRLDPGSTKNRKGEKRIFPFIPELEVLLQQRKERTEMVQRKCKLIMPYVFFRYGTHRSKKKPRPIINFYKDWKAALDAEKISGRKRHDFRSTAARRLYFKYGFKREQVCQMVGWTDTAMFDYYMIWETEDLHETANKISKTLNRIDKKNRKKEKP